MSTIFFLLMQLSIMAYALVAGVFLAFSDFIMRSLAITGGVKAMQVINREVFRWIFMTLFLGMAAVSVVLAVYSWMALSGPESVVLLSAAVIYLVGCFGVTIFFNVPMNEALARMDPASPATGDFWRQTYVPRWTFWNSVRTGASAVSSALLLIGLIWMTQNQAQQF